MLVFKQRPQGYFKSILSLLTKVLTPQYGHCNPYVRSHVDLQVSQSAQSWRYKVYLRIVLVLITLLTIYATVRGQQGQYVFASKTQLSEVDLAGYSEQELQFMRNEILARYGMIFTDPKLKNYFRAQSWYTPSSRNVTDELTYIERVNSDLIAAAEKKTIKSLVHDEKPVKRLWPFVRQTSTDEINGYMLIEYNTKAVSWAVYEFRLLSSDGIEGYNGDNITSIVTRQKLLDAVCNCPLAKGTGNLPRFSEDLNTGTPSIIEYNQLKLNLAHPEDGWYDYQIVGGDSTRSVLLPSKKKPGRVGANTIQKILVRDEDRGFIYETPTGETRFVSADADFKIEGWNPTTKAIIVLGKAFIIENDDNYRIYTDAQPGGKVLPIDSSYTMFFPDCLPPSFPGGLNNCGYTLFERDGRIRYLLSFIDTITLYKFPSRTRVTGDESYGGYTFLIIPGYGRLLIEIINDKIHFTSDGTDVDLSTFVVGL